MLRLLADENLDRTIVAGVRSQLTDVSFPTVQELGLHRTADPELLAWAAEQNFVVVSHDVTTMTKFAIDRIRQSLAMPGLLLIPSTTSPAVATEELLLICQCSEQREWDSMIAFLPL